MTMPNRTSVERGSSLLLFPAGVLIVMVLAAMAVDTSIAFMGQRELANATAAAANDAAARRSTTPRSTSRTASSSIPSPSSRWRWPRCGRLSTRHATPG